jgi:hypothetical protein
MSPEILQIVLVVGGAVAGWIARHNNLLAPKPAPTPTPSTPTPAPVAPSGPSSPSGADTLWQLAWHILREKFPNLPPLDQTK